MMLRQNVSAEFIKKYIAERIPGLCDLLVQVDLVEPLVPKPVTVLTAISQIVIGQMLSRKAAKTIISKATNLAINNDIMEFAFLSENDLRACGISGRKVKTIRQFATYYSENKEEVENWRNLSEAELFETASKHWGISEWSASMLGIFYFGKENIFPTKDGSINKVLSILELRGISVDTNDVTPYKSYLALYLWLFLDSNLLNSYQN